MENKVYTHILQKKGVLKTFTVAKVVRKKDIEELKAIVKSMTKDEEEYNQMLKEELARISDMHNKDNPIPGIIYSENMREIKRGAIYTLAQKISDAVKKQKFDKKEMAFLISAIISNLELDQEDFLKLNEELQQEIDEEDDQDDEDEEEFED